LVFTPINVTDLYRLSHFKFILDQGNLLQLNLMWLKMRSFTYYVVLRQVR